MENNKKENNKIFAKGCVVGIIFVIVLNFLVTNLDDAYRRVISKDLTYKQKMQEIKNIVKKYSVNEFEKDLMEEGVFKGMLASLKDPYSYYMGKNEFKEFLQDTAGNYVGIGIMIKMSDDNFLTISKVFDNSPAKESGILEDDKIIKIENQDVKPENYNEIISSIRGKEGTKVNLTIYREKEDKTFELSVLRKNIDVPTVEHKVLEGNIGYISISQFDRVTSQQFKDAFNNLQSLNTKGLIIDLRDNPGGLLTTVCEITDMLVPEGIITYIEDKYGNKQYEYSKEDFYDKPLAILVNKNSASASEVLTGAVKDYGIGKVVGETTFGKGVVQNIYKISDGSGVKVTIAKYFTPKGICLDGTGITPDFEIKNDNDSTQDLQLDKAIEVINSK